MINFFKILVLSYPFCIASAADMAIRPIPIEPFSESIRSIGNFLLLLAANFADCKVPLTLLVSVWRLHFCSDLLEIVLPLKIS